MEQSAPGTGSGKAQVQELLRQVVTELEQISGEPLTAVARNVHPLFSKHPGCLRFEHRHSMQPASS